MFVIAVFFAAVQRREKLPKARTGSHKTKYPAVWPGVFIKLLYQEEK
jgi:hypothetical protein